jgi:hypothetical protein
VIKDGKKDSKEKWSSKKSSVDLSKEKKTDTSSVGKVTPRKDYSRGPGGRSH